MEQKEIMSHFERLYTKMATSNNPKYMAVFGSTMKSMMKDMATWNPEIAQDYLDKLEAIEWNNYLSKKEAIAIVGNMEPKRYLDTSDWEQWMKAQNISMEEMPYYNKWALYTTMNMVYSDSAHSIAKLKGKSVPEISKEEMLPSLHLFALDKLKDEDGVFNIRTYFCV